MSNKTFFIKYIVIPAVILGGIAYGLFILGQKYVENYFDYHPGMKEVIENFYEEYDNKEFDYIYRELIGENIRKKLSLNEFKVSLLKHLETFGEVLSYKIYGVNLEGIGFSSDKPKGVYIKLKLYVTREKTEVIEEITFVKSGDKWLAFDYSTSIDKETYDKFVKTDKNQQDTADDPM